MKQITIKLVAVIIVLVMALTGISGARAQEETTGNLKDAIYLSDTVQENDGKSLIFSVAIDEVGGRANLTLLPKGEVPFDHVDALAVTPNGRLVFMLDDGPTVYPNTMLAFYDLVTNRIVNVGVIKFNGENLYEIDQASFSPRGVLYITHTPTDTLFTVNTYTAEATEVGPVVDQATGQTVNIQGADIAFTADGSLYLITNLNTTAIYQLTLPVGPGVVSATMLSPTGDNHRVRGMAVRANGYGDLVASTQADELHVIDRTTGVDRGMILPLYWNGSIFDANTGDMSTGKLRK